MQDACKEEPEAWNEGILRSDLHVQLFQIINWILNCLPIFNIQQLYDGIGNILGTNHFMGHVHLLQKYTRDWNIYPTQLIAQGEGNSACMKWALFLTLVWFFSLTAAILTLWSVMLQSPKSSTLVFWAGVMGYGKGGYSKAQFP